MRELSGAVARCAFRSGRLRERENHAHGNTFYLESPEFTALLRGCEGTTASVEATGNLFHKMGQKEFFNIPDWRERIQWKGTNNLYSGKLFETTNNQGKLLRHATRDDWNQLWKEPETGSQFVDTCSPLFVQLTTAALPALRAAAEPVVRAASIRHNLPDLGPNWNLIGAGQAQLNAFYEEHRDAGELRPEIPAGGPIVLLRGGKEVRGFQTVAAATSAAQDQDVIEIRADAVADDCTFYSVKPRLLTLRGAAGYRTTIQALNNRGHDHLILENLVFVQHIRHLLSAGRRAVAPRRHSSPRQLRNDP